MREILLRVVAPGILLSACFTFAAGQIPSSLRAPVAGYLLDTRIQAILPVFGIAGNSTVGKPIDFGVPIREATFLPDQVHAIVASPAVEELLVIDLEETSPPLRISGAPAGITEIRTNREGNTAGLYDTDRNRLLIVKGLPRAPEVRHSVDLAFAKSPLRRFAVSGDGSVVLLAFAGEGSDVLYSWSTASGAHFIGKISRISALVFMDEDAVVADSGLNQIILIRSVRTHAIPELIADSRAGISKPSALFVSSRDEIHVGNADTIVTLNAKGQPLRKAVCACAISMMEKFGDSSIQLTKDLERPIFVLDESRVPERILFIPALTALPATKR